MASGAMLDRPCAPQSRTTATDRSGAQYGRPLVHEIVRVLPRILTQSVKCTVPGNRVVEQEVVPDTPLIRHVRGRSHEEKILHADVEFVENEMINETYTLPSVVTTVQGTDVHPGH